MSSLNVQPAICKGTLQFLIPAFLTIQQVCMAGWSAASSCHRLDTCL